MNIIIKSAEREQRERRILQEYGHSQTSAGKEMREYAESAAEGIRVALNEIRKGERK